MKKILTILSIIVFTAVTTGCSTTPQKSVQSNTIKNQQTVETGIVQSVSIIPVHDHSRSGGFGNVGVTIGSGGRHGIFGAIDVGSLIRVLSKSNQQQTAQEIIVKKSNGKTVAITQSTNIMFKKGDTVKVLLRNGKASVVR